MTMLMVAQAAATGGDSTYVVWGFVLLAVAVGLLVLELFVPSGGMLGVMCAVAAIGSVVAFFAYDTLWGAMSLVGYFFLGPVAVVTAMRLWSSSPLARRLVLGGDQDDPTMSPEEAAYASERARSERLARLRDLVGAEGVTTTLLRPVGFVRIGGQKIDALAENGVIDADTTVIVVDVVDNQVKVRQKDR
jgi:membrane-bound ClpP family serine protease